MTEHIARTLKQARERKGLSQRALSKKAGVPQSHISKIENGAVDLRLSSLIELSRVLDLELALVPRKTVPAVQSIVRSSARSTMPGIDKAGPTFKELNRLENTLASLSKATQQSPQFAQLQRQLRDLRHFEHDSAALESIRQINKSLDTLKTKAPLSDALDPISAQLRTLRNVMAHGLHVSSETDSARPAYSLDEEDSDA